MIGNNIKRIITVLFALIVTKGELLSQSFGNQWIEYNQKYFSIPVAQNGIYRIEYDELNTALLQSGVQLSNVNPAYFQLFFRGEEQYIFIEGEQDGSFDSGDFIEFYGITNDGWADQ